MELTRLPDWRARLSAYIHEFRTTPLDPGSFDCALFAAGAVFVMTGTDFAAPYRGYSSFKTGFRRLRADGFADHVELAAAKLPEISPAFAGPGDVVSLDGLDGLPALGIVQGQGVYAVHAKGVGLAPLIEAKRAFRV